MDIKIKTVNGAWATVDLADVGKAYKDDDVIYFDGTPCVLSTASPTEDAQAVAPDLLEALEDCVQWITANISAMGSMVYGGVNLAEIWLNENKTLQKANAAIAKTKGE
jgi:hypothetical protein